MLTTILTIVGGIGSVAAGILAYKNSANRQRRAAENDVDKKEAEMQSKKEEIRHAVYTNDEAKINAIAARLLSPVLCCAACGAVLLGCATKTVTQYVPTDRHIEPCTNTIGIACQAVPNAVFCELLEKAQELRELRRELDVDKRLQK